MKTTFPSLIDALFPMMRSIKGLIRSQYLVLYLLVDLFFLAFYASTFYPGYLTPDSLYILSQGVGVQQLTNWHPPFITRVWGLLHSIFLSAGGIWIIQISLFIIAAHGFCASLKSKTLGLVCLFLLLAWPPLFTNMAAVWKDNWAIIFTIFCASFALRAGKSGSMLYAVITGVFFILASLTRIDYAAITLPLVYGAFAMAELRDRGGNSHTRFGLYGLLLCIFTFAASSLYVGTWVEKKLNPWTTIAIWDIAGTLKLSGERNDLPGYNCATSDPLVFGQHRLYTVNLPEGPVLNTLSEEATVIKKDWVSAVANHPLAYIEHRLCIAKVFFGFEHDIHYPYPGPVFPETSLTQNAERSALNLKLYWYFDSNAHGPMFKYFFYLALSFSLVIISYFTRTLDLTQMILFVSVCMAAARVMILPAADFRYGLWIVVGSICLATVLIDELMSKFRRRHERIAEPQI